MSEFHIHDWLLPVGVHALCTTRTGGVSMAPYKSFNLGNHVGDVPGAVAINRSRLADVTAPAKPVFLQQVHGVKVLRLDANTLDGCLADACVTTSTDVACTIMVADCLPLLLTDERGQIVAAAHAGWRGLAAGVVEQTVQAMCQTVAVLPVSLRVWLGPCIGPQAFEVGEEVKAAFVTHDPAAAEMFQPQGSKWLANLSGLARQRLRAAGVQHISGNDSSDAWCTVHQRSRFFSYRRDGVTGRFAVCIWRSTV